VITRSGERKQFQCFFLWSAIRFFTLNRLSQAEKTAKFTEDKQNRFIYFFTEGESFEFFLLVIERMKPRMKRMLLKDNLLLGFLLSLKLLLEDFCLNKILFQECFQQFLAWFWLILPSIFQFEIKEFFYKVFLWLDKISFLVFFSTNSFDNFF
jgi:hypothetical protein